VFLLKLQYKKNEPITAFMQITLQRTDHAFKWDSELVPEECAYHTRPHTAETFNTDSDKQTRGHPFMRGETTAYKLN
jgi:hypothetical protein